MSSIVKPPPTSHLASIYTSPIMLILLILVHLFTKNGSAVPVVLPLDPRSSPDTCYNINNCRQLFDIVWGCLATIFACIWVSVHPNVPPPGQSQLVLFWHRLKMMLIGIIAPEIMVGFAARQFWGAQMLSKDFGFSRTHSYFLCMGGFVSLEGYPIATRKQLDNPDLGPEFLKAIRSIDAEDIRDKSKGDALSKGVALAQGIWFTTQCLARVHQRLTVTELEVATLVFAVVNIFLWLLWWDKPLDVQRPMVIGPPTSATQPITPVHLPHLYQLFIAIIGDDDSSKDYHPLSSTPVPSFWSLPMGNNLQFGTTGITALVGSAFGTIHCAAWKTDFPTAAEMWIWQSGSLFIVTIPVILSLDFILIEVMDETAFKRKKLGMVIMVILTWTIAWTFPIYTLARLILIVLPLTMLCLLPPSAFVDINWSTYFLHI